jgi:hypothetical protein
MRKGKGAEAGEKKKNELKEDEYELKKRRKFEKGEPRE